MDKQINKKVGLIIQARMNSSRLAGKVLLPLPFADGTPILGCIVNNLQNTSGKIIVATSTEKENDSLYNFCLENNIECFRGNENNVLSRFVKIQQIHNFDYIVRLTADNPFIDSDSILETIKYHDKMGYDYTNSIGLPLGMNTEVFTGKSLLESLKYVQSQDDLEHVTLILKREEIFRKGVYFFDESLSDFRLTVDTVQDYLVANIVAQIQKEIKYSGIPLIKYIQTNFPWIFEGNSNIIQKNGCVLIEDELKAALSLLENLDFNRTASILKKSIL